MRLEDGRVAPVFVSQALKKPADHRFGRGNADAQLCDVSDLIEGIYRAHD